MKLSLVLLPVVMFSLVTAQAPPQVSIPAQPAPQLFPPNDQKALDGVVFAYDWTTRYYMEGARVEQFIFKTAAKVRTGRTESSFVRVILVWHPADKPQILPSNFYESNQNWRLTLDTATPFDFVRQYCEKEAAPTFTSDIGGGRKVKLARYVSPAVLPPNAGVAKNFSTAIATHPAPPQMPDPRSMPCMYLEKVTRLER